MWWLIELGLHYCIRRKYYSNDLFGTSSGRNYKMVFSNFTSVESSQLFQVQKCIQILYTKLIEYFRSKIQIIGKLWLILRGHIYLCLNIEMSCRWAKWNLKKIRVPWDCRGFMNIQFTCLRFICPRTSVPKMGYKFHINFAKCILFFL